MTSAKKSGYLYILGAAALWGSLGLICKILFEYGLNSPDISFYRLFMGSLFILMYLSFKDISLLKIDRRGFLFTAVIGLIGQTMPNGLYFYAINQTTLTTAVILLYTAPVFTNIISRFLYGECFTPLKLFSIALCVTGVVLTATGGDISTLKFNSIGFITGILAGFTFGLMPILNKCLVGKYDSWTILFYSFLWGSFFLLPMAQPFKILAIKLDLRFWCTFLFLGLFPAMIAYGLYLKGLSMGVPPSKATIISTVEIVVAVFIACTIFNESLNLYNIFGIVMVTFASILIQKKGPVKETVQLKTNVI
ncbi:Permease of the drug/metabolite transporter (DMT) superfamily [Desulfocicer vacuolatum DSM 3385]|uniref:Permease of the drug/metabolite transporter (DMT) superfamily n=1 Tax=Desulfocicer vacuolatum DSM 3385 TaxID=1121400 RepID=A0A1W2AGC5_9BACT|nr:EamA family transporter [Desulfocicer vacuolatum]SMC59755.1 Permease of the drug/metabolite transporter (DMT) superfamily [Desulfocicer vacuolatum DSM 3385]